MLAEYTVLFSNVTGCAMGISDINWSITLLADSEASAIELALRHARAVNASRGMPPHGIRLSESSLRDLAFVYGKPARRGKPRA
jgi:hypothetical protein